MQELIGRVLCGSYRVDSYVGRGGMAEVYRVWDQKRMVYLALKLLHQDLAEDPVFLRRFKREAQTLEKLQHPNIVRFYGLEQDDLLAFILMDYVEGNTLRTEIMRSHGKGGLAQERIYEVMRAVCAALNYAHSMGMVHCDVKPANIMMHNNGTIMISDFGIARQVEGATTTTMVGAGTPAYMAPEQVLGLGPLPQTDVYSLGIVLYEMLTGGERPFIGEQAAITGTTDEKICWEQRNLRPPGPRRFNPAVSAEVEDVVLCCLEKEPGRRYGSAVEVYNALAEALDGGKNFGVEAEAEQPQGHIKETVKEAAWKKCENCGRIYDAGAEHCPFCLPELKAARAAAREKLQDAREKSAIDIKKMWQMLLEMDGRRKKMCLAAAGIAGALLLVLIMALSGGG